MEKIHRSVVRNNAYSRSGISIRERHNERKNECYANEDITLERSHFNVYFKKCESTYIEYFDKLVEDRIISTRGLHADERNRELSEKLGRDVFHYHLHVVYVPIVAKEITRSLRTDKTTSFAQITRVIPEVVRSISSVKKFCKR